MTTHPSAGDTVIPTKTSIVTKPGEGSPRIIECLLARTESTPAARKRHLESSSPKTEVPTKSPRRGEAIEEEEPGGREEIASQKARNIATMCGVNSMKRTEAEVPRSKTPVPNARKRQTPFHKTLKRPSEDAVDGVKSSRKSRADVADVQTAKEAPPQAEQMSVIQKPQMHQLQLPKRDEAVKLRKTIQWLEEGARRMREDLAATRAELHEERRAARLAKRELDSAVREAKVGEAARHLQLISELKSRLAQSPTRPVLDSTSTSSKTEFLKEENHRRELSALRKRLSEAEATVQKLKANACGPHGSGKRRKVESADGRRLEVEVQALRAANKKLEERLQVVTEAERKRGAELRIQHENHEAQLAALQRTLRSDTIKMMDEIRSKTREIEKLEKLVLEGSQMHRKLQTKEDHLMRKLRETERSHQIRLAPRIAEEKISSSNDHVDNSCNGDCDAAAEVERLRELTVEQQEVIEVLRQAVKEKERKLDQISNKKRKEEFYKQWLELEPVVEVEDEDEHEHEEGDSALSSAPSSLSPQPGGCGQWQHTGVTREAYETVLLEVEELQTRLVEEQRELAHAKSQVRDLEKALLQETRGSQNSRRALSDKLREIEDREATLVAELSELREQNELLEFRVLELEESPCLRDTPDPADSGIVSPEPIHLYKDQLSKQRDRAVATVIPYNTYNSPVSPIPQKPPLSLQESGIFDEEDEGEVEMASCGTQTDTPAGDLLQEVQRLHELRARIQERAVKVPVPMIDTKLYSAADVGDVFEAGQTTSYQDRIRELEERLEAHEEAEKKRIRDKQLSKQREEDLLDENYRLTERIYWFENVLRNSKNFVGDLEADQSCSKTEKTESETPLQLPGDADDQEVAESEDTSSSESTLHQSDEIYGQELICESESGEKSNVGVVAKVEGCRECGKMETEIMERLEELVQVEVLTRQRIVDLERREATYMKTLKKADEAWVQVERGYSEQLEELRKKLDLELSTNERLALRAVELENKLKELERCNVCRGDVVEHREDRSKSGDPGADEVDPCLHRRNLERKRSEATKNTRISTPMEVDQPTDVVDGPDLQKGNEENVQKSTSKVKLSPNPEFSSRNSVPSLVSVVNLTSEEDAAGSTEVPEAVAELATEAKEEEVAKTASENGGEVGKAEEVAEEVKEEEDNKGEEGAGTEAVVTINETEPEKKIIYFRWR